MKFFLHLVISSFIVFPIFSEEENLQSQEYIQEYLVPYITDIIDNERWDDLHKFLTKKGCAEKFVQQYAKDFNNAKSIKCKKSKAPIFSNKDDFKKLKITIVSDFNKLNMKDSHELIPAVAKIQDGERTEILPLELSARGNSRGRYCEWRPQRWSFYSKETNSEHSKRDLKKKDDETIESFLARSLKKLDSPSKNGKKDKKTIFGKIGDDIKLVTHCGLTEWNLKPEKTHEAQKEALLQEFVTYQMLDEMKTTVIKTRLAEITYVSPSGEVLKKSIAFFREPRGAMTKRCGLNKLEGVGASNNAISEFQVHLLNKFVGSIDYTLYGHNMHLLANEKGEKVFGPYDFDLTRLFTPKYDSIEKGANALESHLNTHNGNPIAIVQTYALKRKIDKMRDVVNRSPLNEQSKSRFKEWIDQLTISIDNFLKKNLEDNPKLVESLITKDILGKLNKKEKKAQEKPEN